ELVLEPAARRCKAENARHANVLKQVHHHHSTVLKQWRSLCRLLTSPRSAWGWGGPPGSLIPPRPPGTRRKCAGSCRAPRPTQG
ncbi:PREDICTED: neurobeachin-like protein 2, partial [Merops nubicus]|uniref:neurobeachin-like protein 2 n=1 Tax=Merops nubicus TaxID=57421 RepID=UPI0004F09FFD